SCCSIHPSILLSSSKQPPTRRPTSPASMAVLVARQGRELQRYSQRTGGRIVVGCIPYRVRRDDGELEVLVITSQKGHGMMFPKGGWEEDESMDEAARREALEEAGVLGDTEPMLGFWHYQSRRYADQTYEGFMFPLRVADELHQWPEMASRKRTWATVNQVMDGCPHWWMREALEKLVARHAKLQSAL
uniref:Nudix hydrolase domain-containing protein n=3 Tax=Setaria TaxID=4554 RepID=K3YZ23_SETIT